MTDVKRSTFENAVFVNSEPCNLVVDEAALEAANFLKPNNSNEASDPKHDPNNLPYAAEHIFTVNNIIDITNRSNIQSYATKPNFSWQDFEGKVVTDSQGHILGNV